MTRALHETDNFAASRRGDRLKAVSRPDRAGTGAGGGAAIAAAARFAVPGYVRMIPAAAPNQGPCRQQPDADGGVPSLDAAPTPAVTPTLQRPVRACLTGPITTDWPASVLRRHLDAVPFLDRECAADV